MKDGGLFRRGAKEPRHTTAAALTPRRVVPTNSVGRSTRSWQAYQPATFNVSSSHYRPAAAASFTAPVRPTAGNVEWLLVRRCNLEFNVLLYRLVIQHGGTGHYNSTDHNARDGS